MRKVLSILPVGAMVLLIAVTRPVVGQSSTPSAQLLLFGAAAAMQKAGSAHVHIVLQGASSGAAASQLDGQLDGDASWVKPVATHLTGTAIVGGALASILVGSIPLEVTANDTTVAVHAGLLPWACIPLARSGSAKAGKARLTRGSSALAGLTSFGQPTVIGADTIGQVAVWHVKDSISLKRGASTAKMRTALLDLYIAQSDATLRRVTISSSDTQKPVDGHLSATIDLSAFGETVQSQLPAVCANPGGHRSSLAVKSVVSLLRPVLHPANLLRTLGAAH